MHIYFARCLQENKSSSSTTFILTCRTLYSDASSQRDWRKKEKENRPTSHSSYRNKVVHHSNLLRFEYKTTQWTHTVLLVRRRCHRVSLCGRVQAAPTQHVDTRTARHVTSGSRRHTHRTRPRRPQHVIRRHRHNRRSNSTILQNTRHFRSHVICVRRS